MISFLRCSVVISLLAMLVFALLPLDRPHEATFPVDQPPAFPMLAALGGLLAASLLVISAYGLFRFRRWAPMVAGATATLLAGLSMVLVSAPDLALLVSVEAKTMALLSTISLALAVFLTRTSAMRERFRVAL